MFLSSTEEDLHDQRVAVQAAAVEEGFLVDMQPYIAAQGNPPLPVCLQRVDAADVVLVIAAHRYGWIPPDQPGTEQRSITWLECARAAESHPAKEVLAFLIAKGADWPAKFKDSQRLADAAEEGTAPEIAADVQRDVNKLREFKTWLNQRTRADFANTDELRRKAGAALREWKKRHGYSGASLAVTPQPPPPDRPESYLAYLREDTSHIDIRGLASKEGKARRVPIGKLYVRLINARRQSADRAPLDEALKHRRLVVLGDPGSGKSTFLRHVAHAACLRREADPNAPFPILVSVGELAQFINEGGRAHEPDAPAWLPLFLSRYCQGRTLDVGHGFFRDLFEKGPALLLVDGLDEAPTDESRLAVSRLLEKAANAWRGTSIAVTTRPRAFDDEVMLRGFDQAEVAPLDDEAIREFLRLWSASLFEGDPGRAAGYAVEVEGAIRSRPDIRRIASNPVMLTALSVLQWNEKRMPDHRADLYGSVVSWLASQRKNRPGRPLAAACIDILQDLARAMHGHPDGRKVQASRDWAAVAIASRFPERDVEKARAFLREEELDSGIVVSRGADVRFWHLTFQEYLTALWLSNREGERARILFTEGRAWQPEWREVVLLLAGLLLDQGVERLDAFVTAVLDDLYKPRWGQLVKHWIGLGYQPGLMDQARTSFLLGAIIQDLARRTYRPADARFRQVLESVAGIFDPEIAAGIPLQVRLETAEALGQAGDPRLRTPADEDYWVSIPGESFQIGRYPVTVWEYAKFVEAGGLAPGDWRNQLRHPNWPVTEVTYDQAKAYCRAMRVALPTEQQWERAAAGPKGRVYPWGDGEPDPDRANYSGTKIGHPTPVGLFPRGNTPEGVADMAGNVWEWTASDHEAGGKVLRGASYRLVSRNLRASVRALVLIDSVAGFRCVRESVTP